jgi:outer membrane protein assembly factor BamA
LPSSQAEYGVSNACGHILSWLQALGLRGQFFANAGNLTTWDRLLDEKKWMKNLADDTRVSVGMGLVWGTRIGRLEANYSWILKAHDHVGASHLALRERPPD